MLLNYQVAAISSLYLDYYLMNTVFGPRNKYSPFIWWGYFVFDNTIDAYLAYVTEYGVASSLAKAVYPIWSYISAIVALFVVCSTWRGDVVQVGVTQLAADVFSGVISILAIACVNIPMGADTSIGFTHPFGVRSLLSAGASLAMIMLIRVPATFIIRTIAQAVKRHRMPFAIVGILLIAVFSSMPFLDDWLFSVNIAVPIIAAALAVVLLRKSRVIARRKALLAQCLEIADTYELLVGERLSSLERDLAALEGHEEALEHLKMSDDGRFAARIDELQGAYERLSSGSYCDQPVLDAILMSSAERLQSLGVRPEFSVAGIPANQAIDVTLAMSLLNVACGAAVRQEDDVARGSKAIFRIRGGDKGMLYRLDVPASWGFLGAKRSLAVLPDDDSLLVQERVRDGRSVVLVMNGVGEQ